MSKLDDLGAWRAFLMFAKTGSLTAAAQSLNVDASVVSRAISALEKSLGCELIHHSVRPLQLTETVKNCCQTHGTDRQGTRQPDAETH